MQTANILLAISGNRGHTVPKYNVTPAEVAVLRFLHGDDAVYDVEVLKETARRTARQEVERLRQLYSRRDGADLESPAVKALYPGFDARVEMTFADLELHETLYKAERYRLVPEDDVAPIAFTDMTADQLRTYAEKNRIEVTGITRKADLLEAILLAETPAETPLFT